MLQERQTNANKEGCTLKEILKTIPKLNSAGQLIHATQTHEIGSSIFEEAKQRKTEAKAVEEVKRIKKEATHQWHIDELQKLRKDKPDEKLWTMQDFKLAIRAVKTREDSRVPKDKMGLQNMWSQLKIREPTAFSDENAVVINAPEQSSGTNMEEDKDVKTVI